MNGRHRLDVDDDINRGVRRSCKPVRAVVVVVQLTVRSPTAVRNPIITFFFSPSFFPFPFLSLNHTMGFVCFAKLTCGAKKKNGVVPSRFLRPFVLHNEAQEIQSPTERSEV